MKQGTPIQQSGDQVASQLQASSEQYVASLPREQLSTGVPLDAPILYFDNQPNDPWTFRHAFTGTQIFGGTGSGKTSGSGRTFALALLSARYEGRYPFGGLVLTAKPDELDQWANPNPNEPKKIGYCSLTKRLDDVMVIGTNVEKYRSWGIKTPKDGDPHAFDFLIYELEYFQKHFGGRSGNFTQNLVSLLFTALEAGQDRGASNADPYWEDALRQLLTNTIDLVIMATDSLTLEDITKVILTAPQTQGEAFSKKWQDDSFCWHCLHEAHKSMKNRPPAAMEDLRQTTEYWLLDFAGLAERTRSVIVSSFTSKATTLLRSPMRQLFAAKRCTVTPDNTFQGKIIILDLSVKEYGEVGRFAQILFKTVWQRAAERRKLNDFPNPVFLWADESQYFVTQEDMIFQQTARSQRAATVYLTQNIANYYAVMGGRNGNAPTESLLGNFQTKIFHANGDPATNEWAERLFGKELKPMKNTSRTVVGQPSNTSGTTWQPQSAFSSEEFIRLRTGGDQDPTVDGIVFVTAYPWQREGMDRPGVLVSFNQNLQPPERCE